MPEPKESPQGGDSSKIEVKSDGLKQLFNEMPEVVPDAVAAAKAKDAENKADLQDFKDKFNHAFDPNLHETDSDGNPKITPSGRLKYKAGAKFKSKVESILNAPKPEVSGDPQKDKITAAANQFADSFIAAGVMIVGDEWKDQKGEREQLVEANCRIFERYGVVEIHPIANVTLVYGLYIFKRVMKPQSKSQMIFNHMVKKTKEFFVKVGDWFKYTVFRRPRPSVFKPQPKVEGSNAKSS